MASYSKKNYWFSVRESYFLQKSKLEIAMECLCNLAILWKIKQLVRRHCYLYSEQCMSKILFAWNALFSHSVVDFFLGLYDCVRQSLFTPFKNCFELLKRDVFYEDYSHLTFILYNIWTLYPIPNSTLNKICCMIYKWSSNFRPHNINNFSFNYHFGHNVGINKHAFHVTSQIMWVNVSWK